MAMAREMAMMAIKQELQPALDNLAAWPEMTA
jgi:hypothetical protein